MKLVLGRGVLALAALATASFSLAQSVIQPGQLATAAQVAVPVSAVNSPATSSVLPPKNSVVEERGSHDKMLNGFWIASMFMAAGASSADAATSWGKREGNPLLASSNGTFGVKGVSIKAGIAAAVLVPQICLHRHKELKGVFTAGNLGEAAIFSGVAVHNLNIKAPPPTH